MSAAARPLAQPPTAAAWCRRRCAWPNAWRASAAPTRPKPSCAARARPATRRRRPRRSWRACCRRSAATARPKSQWRAILATAPDDLSALHGLLRVLRLRLRLVDAEALVADGMRRWPGARQLALEAARIAAQRENYPEAARRYHRVLAMPGAAAEPLEELAQVLVAQHRFAAATAILDRLAAAEPSRAALARGAGPRRRGGRRRRARARPLGRGAEPRAPAPARAGRDRAAARGRGTADRGRGDVPRPRRAPSRRDRALLPARPHGDCPSRTSRPRSRWLERATAMRPDDPGAAALMVRALAGQNRFRKASSMARALADRLPEHLDAHSAGALGRGARRPDRSRGGRAATHAGPISRRPSSQRCAWPSCSPAMTARGEALEVLEVAHAPSIPTRCPSGWR